MAVRSVLLFGANGFVGSHIARALVSAGHKVAGFGQAMPVDLIADLAGRITMIEGSVEDFAAVSAALERSAPEVVIWSIGHNAQAQGLMHSGEIEPARALGVNVIGWTNVLRAAQQRGVARVLAAGSSVVFGPARLYAERRVEESATPRPTTVYGLSKLMAEQAAQTYRDRFALAVTTLRLPLVFGPDRWYGGAAALLNRLLEAAAPGASAPCHAPIDPFDLIHVEDAAQALRLAVESSAELQSVYHVTGFTTTYPAIVFALKRLVPDFEIYFEAAPAGLVLPLMRAERIARDLGYSARYDLTGALENYFGNRTLGGQR